MKTIYAKQATEENTKLFGEFQRLPDTDIAQGEGWDCWLTADPCLDGPACFSYDQIHGGLPCEVSELTLNQGGQLLLVAGSLDPVVFVLAESLRAKTDAAVGDNQDAAAGTRGPDLAHLQAVILQPGDILILRDGVWYDSGHSVTGQDAEIYRIGQVSADSPRCELDEKQTVRVLYEN